MNCRDPTATPSAMLPSVTAGVFACAPARAASRSFMANDFCVQWVPLCSGSGVGDVEILQERRHQDRVTHNVAVIRVPLIRQASAFLHRVLRVVGTDKLLWRCFTQGRSRQSREGIPSLAARLYFLTSLPPPIPRPGCTPGCVNVSLLCTTILRHWREPFLFNMGHVSMFPRCCCCVLWERTAAPPRALPSTRSFQSNFSHQH